MPSILISGRLTTGGLWKALLPTCPNPELLPTVCRDELEEMLSICGAVPHVTPDSAALAPAHRKVRCRLLLNAPSFVPRFVPIPIRADSQVEKSWAPPELRTFSFIPAKYASAILTFDPPQL
eukprot:1876797-Rhodomonas_salina.2